ncbi:MAG TPA: hypothetical protein VM580_32410 [Labilithrix sp.]|jgi:hypothetical protein|nr:hypothetical protein [Labilithrix sp.]
MSLRVVPTAAVVLFSLALVGCPSKEQQSSSGATSPSAAESGGTGPLAALEAAPFVDEIWTSQEGQQMTFIQFARENVRVSAQCRQPNGLLACDAIRQLRGAPVAIPRRSLTGNISAGTRVCIELKQQLVTGHNATGSEDGFCRFPDGSMVSTGALEQYGMRVTD